MLNYKFDYILINPIW